MKMFAGTMLLGLIVLLGWLIKSEVLVHVRDGWVSMKPITAVLFVMSGMAGVFRQLKDGYCRPVIVVTTVLISYTLGSQMAGYQLNPFSEGTEVLSVNAGIPSLMTLGAFAIFLRGAWEPGRWHQKAVICVGAVALCGYLLQFPLLYYYLPKYSTAMAIHTAAGFVLLGKGLGGIPD